LYKLKKLKLYSKSSLNHLHNFFKIHLV